MAPNVRPCDGCDNFETLRLSRALASRCRQYFFAGRRVNLLKAGGRLIPRRVTKYFLIEGLLYSRVAAPSTTAIKSAEFSGNQTEKFLSFRKLFANPEELNLLNIQRRDQINRTKPTRACTAGWIDRVGSQPRNKCREH